jgi:hypothetical protein
MYDKSSDLKNHGVILYFFGPGSAKKQVKTMILLFLSAPVLSFFQIYIAFQIRSAKDNAGVYSSRFD